jgi:hypothetical protein
MGTNSNLDTSIPTGSEEGTDNAVNLSDLRIAAANLILDSQKAQETLTPPAIQELVLATRDFESGRMRLGVALAYVNGQDPLGQK